MFKIEKPTFFRLYRYYLKKLFPAWLFLIILTLVLVSLISLEWPWHLFKAPKNESWGFLWHYSLIRLGILLPMSISLISLLVQKAKNEDSWILTLASPNNRSTIMAAKLATFFTYYFPSSLIFTNLFAFSNPLFLLVDWFLLILTNFLLFLTPIFYFFFPAQSRIKKFLILGLYGLSILGIFYWSLNNPEIGKIFVNNPWVPMLLSIFIGPFFAWLYWDNFRNHDY